MNLKFDRNELDWSAICYLTGEFDELSHQQFEAYVAEHLDGQQALENAIDTLLYSAAAVRAMDENKVVKVVTVPRLLPQRNWRLMAALAATVLLMCSFGIWYSIQTTNPVAVDDSNKDMLALFWSYAVDSDEFGLTSPSAEDGSAIQIDPDALETEQIEYFQSYVDLPEDDNSDSDWLSIAVSSLIQNEQD